MLPPAAGRWQLLGAAKLRYRSRAHRQTSFSVNITLFVQDGAVYGHAPDSAADRRAGAPQLWTMNPKGFQQWAMDLKGFQQEQGSADPNRARRHYRQNLTSE